MKKIGVLFSVLFFSFLVSIGCSNGDSEGESGITPEGEVSGKVLNLDSEIDSIRIILDNGYEHVIGDGKLTDSKLILKLDDVIPDGYLNFANHQYSSNSYSGSDYSYTEKYTLSDSTVRISDEIFVDAYSQGNYVGGFFRTNTSLENILNENLVPGIAVGMFVYCNKPIAVTGRYSSTNINDKGESYSEEGNYNMNLRKGWNEIVSKVTSVSASKNIFYSVTANDGSAGMRWVYVPDDDDYYGVAPREKNKKGIMFRLNSRISLHVHQKSSYMRKPKSILE